MGTPDKPALVVLDDCQWADELMTKLIVHWHANRGDDARGGMRRGGGHVLVVAAFRSEEVAADHAFRRIRPPLHLRLSLFEPDDIRRLAESMAGPLPEAAVDDDHRPLRRLPVHGLRRAPRDGGIGGPGGGAAGLAR